MPWVNLFFWMMIVLTALAIYLSLCHYAGEEDAIRKIAWEQRSGAQKKFIPLKDPAVRTQTKFLDVGRPLSEMNPVSCEYWLPEYGKPKHVNPKQGKAADDSCQTYAC
jgi:hypothetical protein